MAAPFISFIYRTRSCFGQQARNIAGDGLAGGKGWGCLAATGLVSFLPVLGLVRVITWSVTMTPALCDL